VTPLDLAAGSRENLRVHQSVTSTNDVARDWVAGGAADAATVVADFQTRGRGRTGREWKSPPGAGLALSQVFFAPPESLRLVPLLGALAARAAIADHLPEVMPVGIKWPNDIQVLGFKVAGILTETVTPPGGGRGQSAAVLGIGVNINTRATAFVKDLRRPAASLRMLCGRRIDRAAFLESLLLHLDAQRTRWGQTPRRLVSDFAEHCITLGRRVRVSPPGAEAYTATACGIDPGGCLLVEAEGGETVPVAAGDVDLLD